MLKLRIAALAAALVSTGSIGAGSSKAAVLGPEAQVCNEAHRPAMLVKVTGLKARTGVIRVQSYGGDPANFFDKGSYLKRIEVRAPASGTIEVCVPVEREGVYAVSVRHDVNGSGKSDMSDGGGMSGNPDLSMWDVMFKRKPDPARVSVRVRDGIAVVPVTLRYLQGGSFKPVKREG
ncbi:DUF2141 domain-containing protein [Sphingomonas naphthae]|uniref:DUF2141 domain-containing protein n=1 Tax=Sphingomonas naphthae TaxID=1813468 RepID=A0ABY7THZ9_9SPHN|nr:DUF2141 domain-containing protein [Sphingomonas naphthae]WCT72841.1 DUF2141 domain-containing protein [Sphingomonas naphthae]